MTTPVRIAVLGASGRMGRLVVAQISANPATALAAAVVHVHSISLGTDAGSFAGVGPMGCVIEAAGPGCFRDAQVIIDFSLPQALQDALPHVGATPLVSGTTGLNAAQVAALESQSRRAAVLRADNFSTGLTVLRDLVAKAAAVLDDFDIEIVEAHHRHKRDAPSGTALALARSAATARGQVLDEVAVHGRRGQVGPRPAGEIGIHAVRGGGVVGHHTVWLAGDHERLELRHTAESRDVFATGALRAACWLRTKPPGFYGMRDVLNLA